MRATVVTLLGGLILSSSLPAYGQNSAVAEEQFQRGVTALKEEKFAEACPALAESQRLDPRPGTLFTLADCEARWGKVASASSHLSDYLAQTASLPPAQATKHADRRKLAQSRLAELKPLIPRLTLVLPSKEAADVSLDGVQLGGASLGIALPVDPGEHAAVVRVGKEEKTTTIKIGKGEQLSVTLLMPAPAAQGAAVEARPTPSTVDPAKDARPAQPGEAPRPEGRSPLVYVAGGVGVVGVAVGTVAGLVALNKKGIVDEQCHGTKCTPDGKKAGDTANQAALASTIGFGVGVVGLAAATYLLLTSPKPAEQTARRWRVEPGLSTAWTGVVVSRGW